MLKNNQRTKQPDLERLTESTLKKYNRITFKERISHIGRWSWQNKLFVVGSAVLAYLLYKTGNGIYHDLFVANGPVKEYVSNAYVSLDSLAKSLGETMVQSPSPEKTLAVQNHYLEFLTNLKFAAQHCKEASLSKVIDGISANSQLFSGTIPGEQGLVKVNEFRPILIETISKYSAKADWFFTFFFSVIGSIILSSSFRFNKPDEAYKERLDTATALNEAIKYKLPQTFKHLQDFPNKDLLYKIATTCTLETKDPELGLNFLLMAKETPEVFVTYFEKQFGTIAFNYRRNNRHGSKSGAITKDELISFVETHLQEHESNGFDYGLMKFSSIGGYDDIKEQLILYASIFADPQEASYHGVEGLTGIILEGPPGCGKTLLAEAFINEALKPLGYKKRSHYKIVSAADLKSLWYSQSEKNIQKLYCDARRKAPYIIFIDEGEELFSKRGTGHEADTSATNQLLTEIGGIKRIDRVLTIITTNRSEAIDEAAKRYGRLGTAFTIDVPNKEGRKEIAKIHLGRLDRRELLDGFDYDAFAAASDNYTGADIAGIISKTFWKRFEDIKMERKQPYKLTTQDFIDTAKFYSKTIKKVGFDPKQ